MDALKVAAGSEGEAARPADAWRGFDAFVAQNVQTMRDAGNLYATIAFMQRIEGEKHLVFVTERGFQLPRWDDERDLARVAADSRVAIDVLQTGGLVGPLMAATLRTLSEVSGGMASISKYSRLGLARLDEATTSSYLLGYYPTNAKWDGAFRAISVKVNRPGVTLPTAAATTPASRRRCSTGSSTSPASAWRERCDYRDDVKDIGVTLTASLARAEQADVRRREGPDRPRGAALRGQGRRSSFGRVTIAVVPMDSSHAVIGGKYKRQVVYPKYNRETLALVRKIGIPYDARLPVPAETRFIRVIVYDAAADRVGSAGVAVR